MFFPLTPLFAIAKFNIMERNESAPAIVINSERWKERDRMITLLSPLWGVVRVVVYGAQKSIKAIKAPLYTEGTFVVYHNRERNTRSLVDLTPISIHENVLSSFSSSAAASLFSELIMLQRGEDALLHYDLLTTALDSMDEENYRRIIIQYLLRYLDGIGQGSDYTYCPSCMKEYDKSEILGFSSFLNVPVCSSCDTMGQSLILPPSARSYLRDSLLVSFERAMTFFISTNMEERLLRYLLRITTLALGTELKCVKSGVLSCLL